MTTSLKLIVFSEADYEYNYICVAIQLATSYTHVATFKVVSKFWRCGSFTLDKFQMQLVPLWNYLSVYLWYLVALYPGLILTNAWLGHTMLQNFAIIIYKLQQNPLTESLVLSGLLSLYHDQGDNLSLPQIQCM